MLTQWTDRLAFDVALRMEGSGEDLPDIAKRHAITDAELLKFCTDTIFCKTVAHYRTEVREKGLTFKLKARAQAEELLATSWKLIHAHDVNPSVKADLIKHTVKWAGLEPRDSPSTGAEGGVRIVINMGEASEPRTIEAAASSPLLELDHAVTPV